MEEAIRIYLLTTYALGFLLALRHAMEDRPSNTFKTWRTALVLLVSPVAVPIWYVELCVEFYRRYSGGRKRR